MSKVVHVELLNPFGEEEKHNYFGSIAAIYGSFTADRLGISKGGLWNYRVTEERPYVNNQCIIRVGGCKRKSTHRGQIQK